jgi:hypothetical protein
MNMEIFIPYGEGIAEVQEKLLLKVATDSFFRSHSVFSR